MYVTLLLPWAPDISDNAGRREQASAIRNEDMSVHEIPARGREEQYGGTHVRLAAGAASGARLGHVRVEVGRVCHKHSEYIRPARVADIAHQSSGRAQTCPRSSRWGRRQVQIGRAHV